MVMNLPQPLEELIALVTAIPVSDWLWSLGIMAAAIVVGLLLAHLLAKAIRKGTAATTTTLDDNVVAELGPPLRFSVPVLMVRAVLPLMALPAGATAVTGHLCTVVLLSLGGWLLLRVVGLVETIVLRRIQADVSDALHARALRTQLRGFHNIANFAIGVLTLGVILMSFEQVRRLGMSLLASAGVASVVIGFAAQRSIATVIAGIQIALSQPIRVDDVVIVEGEWGRIEEITLTYVVVKVWDERRLVVPISYFIEQSFQNWTRSSSELLGTVFIYVDYHMPINDLRQALARLVEENPLWDKRVAQLVVTDAKERTVEVRALVSAADASKLWDLRCEVREGLIDYIRREHPECLPTVRAQLESSSTPEGGRSLRAE